MLSTADLHAAAEDLRSRQTWLRARALGFCRRWAPAVSVEAALLGGSAWRSAGPVAGDRTRAVFSGVYGAFGCKTPIPKGKIEADATQLPGNRSRFHDQPRIPKPRTLLRRPGEASLHVDLCRLSPRPRGLRSRRSRKCGRCAGGGAPGTIQATRRAARRHEESSPRPGANARNIAAGRGRCRPRHPQRGDAGSTRRRRPSRLSVRR
jgi:hypothetical protein